MDTPRSSTAAVSRRQFLNLVATTGIAGGLGHLSGRPANSPNDHGSPPRALTAATFEPHVGSRFLVCCRDSRTLHVELVEAEAHPFDVQRPAHVRREPFTLIFRAAKGTPFEDQICRIRHPRLGTIDAFLSRVDMPKRDVKLQAVFG